MTESYRNTSSPTCSNPTRVNPGTCTLQGHTQLRKVSPPSCVILITSMTVAILYQTGRHREALELSRGLSLPQDVLMGSRSALYLRELRMAETMLAQHGPFEDTADEAERLALLGTVYYEQGKFEQSRQLARESNLIAQTFSTRLLLGKVLPPGEGLPILREAMALARTPDDECEVSSSLAYAYVLMGQFRDALPHASLTALRRPTPHHTLEWVRCSLYGSNDVSLDYLAEVLQPLLESDEPPVMCGAHYFMAMIELMNRRPARALGYFEVIVPGISPQDLAIIAPLGIRLLKMMGRSNQAMQMAQATQLARESSPAYAGLAYQALGMALYPDPKAEPLLEKAVELLLEESAFRALISQAYLASLRHEPLPDTYVSLLDQWSSRAQKLLPPNFRAVGSHSFYLQAMGGARLLGPEGQVILQRQRCLELLTLLLSRREGWSHEELSLALYGIPRSTALKVEIFRLRQALGGGILARPWQLATHVGADFLELEEKVGMGSLVDGFEVFGRPLLPGSSAPGIEELRHKLEDSVRIAILGSGDANLLFQLAHHLPEDLEVWEVLLGQLGQHNSQYPAVLARVEKLRREYLTF